MRERLLTVITSTCKNLKSIYLKYRLRCYIVRLCMFARVSLVLANHYEAELSFYIFFMLIQYSDGDLFIFPLVSFVSFGSLRFQALKIELLIKKLVFLAKVIIHHIFTSNGLSKWKPDQKSKQITFIEL